MCKNLHILLPQKLVKGNFMPLQSQNKKERLSFFVNSDLSQKINKISKQNNQTISELVRTALKNYIEQIEKEKIEKELEAGYRVNYNYYLNSEGEWNYADKE